MDVELSWQTFACTGDILCYLDYRRQLAQQRLTAPAGEKTDGYHCDPGPCPEETRYKESDRIITLLTPGLGVISASAQSSLRLKRQTVQRLRAFLLLGVRACPRTEYVYSARGGCQKTSSMASRLPSKG